MGVGTKGKNRAQGARTKIVTPCLACGRPHYLCLTEPCLARSRRDRLALAAARNRSAQMLFEENAVLVIRQRLADERDTDVRSQLGFHLAELTDRRPRPPSNFLSAVYFDRSDDQWAYRAEQGRARKTRVAG